MDEQEEDSGFPSGPWVGYYTYAKYPGQGFQQTEVDLAFKAGRITGSGADNIGNFVVKGRYDVKTRQCNWTKSYIGQHSLTYQGHQSGKTIQGKWETSAHWTGSFSLWPRGERGLSGEFFITESEATPKSVELVSTR